jgi:hypothetical protein
MHGAREYQLEGLMVLLEEYMLDRVGKDNAALLYRVAVHYSLPLLRYNTSDHLLPCLFFFSTMLSDVM